MGLGLTSKVGRAQVGAWVVHGWCMGCAWHGDLSVGGVLAGDGEEVVVQFL